MFMLIVVRLMRVAIVKPLITNGALGAAANQNRGHILEAEYVSVF